MGSTVTGSTSRRPALAIAAAVVGFAILTALVFLVRAGDPGESNWPVTWELRSSDNGVLFQFMQDLFAGRALDWSFSPQVFVVPELPISFVAYVVTGGNVYGYYLAVAVIDNVLLFLAIMGTLRMIFPRDALAGSLARTAVASTPLVLFPLVGTAWILSFPLAPTYYFGMYLVLLAGPMVVLARSGWVRGLLVGAMALAVASNPLVLVFAAPGFAVAVVLLAVRRGVRAASRAALPVGIVLVVAAVARLSLLTPLQGTSPLTYIDPEVFAERWSQLGPYFDWVAQDTAARVILGLGAVLAVACLIGSIVVAIGYLRGSFLNRHLALVYLGLVPVLGIVATMAVMITHYLYFWPALLLPYVAVLMVMPARWAMRALPGAGVVFLAVAIATGAPWNLAHQDRYVGYRSDETRCIDAGLPDGVTIGYATFSDARRVSLTSLTPFRLVQIRPDGSPTLWLTNRAYLRDAPGQFFYVNGHGDELPLDTTFITSTFGLPDETFGCGDDREVLVYTDPDKVAAIAAHYASAPRG